ncbi:MAG: hypothetical protein ABI035_03220 [Gemmatimonadaceae bacterium]
MNSLAVAISTFGKAIAVLMLLSGSTLFAQTTQDSIHHMSHNVMPFNMSKTLHIFTMTESGGVERIVARAPIERDQIAMIQQHLKLEAEKFQRGDYSDPAKLHGTDMPGLKELRKGASGIKVSYTKLSAGAEIKFETTDLHLLTAIHRWFGAQLSEHGADAEAG